MPADPHPPRRHRRASRAHPSAARRGAISISAGNKWLIGTVDVVLMLYYVIGVDQGA